MKVIGTLEALGEPFLVGVRDEARSWAASAEQGPMFELIEHLASHDLEQIANSVVAWAVRADGEIVVVEVDRHFVALSWLTAEQDVVLADLLELAAAPADPAQTEMASIATGDGPVVLMTSTWTHDVAADRPGTSLELAVPPGPWTLTADRVDGSRGTAQRLCNVPVAHAT